MAGGGRVATRYIRDETGRIDGVRYDELAPMLLNEVQRQQKMTAVQAAQIVSQAAEIRELKQQQERLATQAEVQDLKQQLQAALLKPRAQDDLAARR